MLRIEVSLPPEIDSAHAVVIRAEKIGDGPSAWVVAKYEAERGLESVPDESKSVELHVVVAKCVICETPFIQCRSNHRHCPKDSCRKASSRKGIKYEPETGG